MYDFKCTDALTYLSSLKNNSVDLVLTDPPYIISKDTGFHSVVTGVERFSVSMDYGEWDKTEVGKHHKLLADCCAEWYRVLKSGGTCIIWYDYKKLQTIIELMEAAGFKQIRIIIWKKTNPVPLNSSVNYLSNAFEMAVLGVKKGKPTFHSKYDSGVYEYPIPRDGGKRIHPTQKSIKLTQELIEKHSNPGDTVLDTFAGSATHLAAALRCGRKAVGCEIDASYFELANRRLQS